MQGTQDRMITPRRIASHTDSNCGAANVLSILETAVKLLNKFRPTSGPGVLSAYELEVFLSSHLAPQPINRWVGLGLTRLQGRFMDRLFIKPGEYVSRAALFDATYFDNEDAPEPKIVDINLMFIRRKLEGTRYSIPLQHRYPHGYRGVIAAAGEERVKQEYSHAC